MLATARTVSALPFMFSIHAGLRCVLSKDGCYKVFTGTVRAQGPVLQEKRTQVLHRARVILFLEGFCRAPCNLSNLRRVNTDYNLTFLVGYMNYCQVVKDLYSWSVGPLPDKLLPC